MTADHQVERAILERERCPVGGLLDAHTEGSEALSCELEIGRPGLGRGKDAGQPLASGERLCEHLATAGLDVEDRVRTTETQGE